MVKTKVEVIYPEITTFGQSQIRVLKPIKTAIRHDDADSFVAEFFEAGISASGPTPMEAFSMLREEILATFRLYLKNESRLGRWPSKQLAILREFVAEAE